MLVTFSPLTHFSVIVFPFSENVEVFITFPFLIVVELEAKEEENEEELELKEEKLLDPPEKNEDCCVRAFLGFPHKEGRV